MSQSTAAARSTSPSTGAPAGIDPRGPQFNASVTAVVLAVILVAAPHPAAVALLGLQAVLFAWGAIAGVARTPLAWVFRAAVRPRLAPPTELEDPAPPRFAQAVGLGFALVGLVGFLAGVDTLGLIAVGMALVAALLNAVFRFCLGCEMYLLGKRLTTRAA
ncbi:DUF4395 domain-containing protein [Nocardioides sp.]|uniref:DUF4395 domain-containing protein n=1 Tax=Nocardioides sp. TaxID=35761 RepID=UPI003517670E